MLCTYCLIFIAAFIGMAKGKANTDIVQATKNMIENPADPNWVNYDHCSFAAPIRSNDRYASTDQTPSNKCDTWFSNGWYRFTDPDGNSFTNSFLHTECLKPQVCGSEISLRIDMGGQEYPNYHEEIEVSICGAYNSLDNKFDCCALRQPAAIRNCSDYLAYRLPMLDRCSQRYCVKTTRDEKPSHDLLTFMTAEYNASEFAFKEDYYKTHPREPYMEWWTEVSFDRITVRKDLYEITSTDAIKSSNVTGDNITSENNSYNTLEEDILLTTTSHEDATQNILTTNNLTVMNTTDNIERRLTNAYITTSSSLNEESSSITALMDERETITESMLQSMITEAFTNKNVPYDIQSTDSSSQSGVIPPTNATSYTGVIPPTNATSQTGVIPPTNATSQTGVIRATNATSQTDITNRPTTLPSALPNAFADASETTLLPIEPSFTTQNSSSKVHVNSSDVEGRVILEFDCLLCEKASITEQVKRVGLAMRHLLLTYYDWGTKVVTASNLFVNVIHLKTASQGNMDKLIVSVTYDDKDDHEVSIAADAILQLFKNPKADDEFDNQTYGRLQKVSKYDLEQVQTSLAAEPEPEPSFFYQQLPLFIAIICMALTCLLILVFALVYLKRYRRNLSWSTVKDTERARLQDVTETRGNENPLPDSEITKDEQPVCETTVGVNGTQHHHYDDEKGWIVPIEQAPDSFLVIALQSADTKL